MQMVAGQQRYAVKMMQRSFTCLSLAGKIEAFLRRLKIDWNQNDIGIVENKERSGTYDQFCSQQQCMGWTAGFLATLHTISTDLCM
jgi:hypothetical protein